MENNVEKRVSRLEGITGKLAGMTQQVMDGQKTLAEVVIELSKEITGDFREEIKEEIVASGIKTSQYVDKKIGDIKGDIVGIQKSIKNDCISGIQISELEKERRRRVIHLLSGIKSDKYKVFGSAYFKESGQDILYKFKESEPKLLSFSFIKKTQFNDVLLYVRNWNPNKSKIKATVISNMLDLKDETVKLKEEINNGNLSEADKLSKAVQINKNESKYKKFDEFMKNTFGGEE